MNGAREYLRWYSIDAQRKRTAFGSPCWHPLGFDGLMLDLEHASRHASVPHREARPDGSEMTDRGGILGLSANIVLSGPPGT